MAWLAPSTASEASFIPFGDRGLLPEAGARFETNSDSQPLGR